MINKSFQLLRTDPLLTSNFKVVVASDYKLYLESFNTNAELSNVKFKHYPIYKTEYLENKIPHFYKGLPIELAFDVRYDNDNKIVHNNFDKQFDTTYFAGGGYIEDQWHNEEFDYLAPLYIRKNSIPNGFIILRVDDPSGYNLNVNNYFELNSLDATKFNEIVDNWKCIKYFDMTYSSNLGEWLYTNYLNNNRFPKTAFEYHPERAEFSNWFGMDYSTGIYTSKPLFIEDRNEIETPHFRFEKYITEGYRRSGLIYPFILNLKFLFDDTPATPYSLRKYSMNRYYGFYVDNMDFVGSITSYRTPPMIPDTYLVNNIIVSGSTGMTTDQYCLLEYYDVPSPNPFVEEWDNDKEYYVFIDNTSDFYRTKTVSGLYPVRKILQDNKYIYKVISDEILDAYWNTGYTNIKTVDINYNNYNIITGVTDGFFIDKYIDCDANEKYMYGDLYLIKIDENYHVIKYSSGMTITNELTVNPSTGDINDYKYFISTDYAINLNEKYIEYWILGKNSPYYKQLAVQNKGVTPLTFPIYRIKFSDIKDFDFDRVNTEYSDFDYEKTEYVETDEEKLYAFDYNDPSIPPRKRVGKLGAPDQYKISTISSEYIAGDELYEVFDMGQQNSSVGNYGVDNKLYDLTDIWRKNQTVVKWGFMGSISHSDYPYKLNNNYEIGGPYNRTVDPFYTIPNVTSKNLDYFYRLGNFYNADTGDTVYYKNQTTNIQYDFISGQIGSGFDIKAYFTLNFDYFTFFFKNKMYFEDISTRYTKAYDKYSVFNYGDSNIPSVTLFKGLKIKVKEVKNIYIDDNNQITKVLYGNKTYNNYKLSIIFNENYDGVNTGLMNNDINEYIDTTQNGINVILNDKFQNILIIINAKMSGDTTLNDTSVFNEKDGLYYGKKLDNTYLSNYNPSLFTASNFINAINDYAGAFNLLVKYYYIKENNGTFYNGSSLISRGDGVGITFETINPMTNIPNWNYYFPPFMLNIETPINISLNNNCYTTYPYYVNSVNDDYVATLLTFDDTKSFKVQIYRFSGPYEPIFKDINLFKGGYFCYNNITGSTIPATGNTTSNGSISFDIPRPGDIPWSNFQNMCSTTSDYVDINLPPSAILTYSRYLSVRGFDFSNIPPDAVIDGITLTLNRKAFVNTTDKYVKLSNIYLAKNCYDKDNLSETRSLGVDEIEWSTTLSESTYGGDTDTWGDVISGSWVGSTLVGSDIRDPLFGVVLNVAMLNNSATSTILPQIKCVRLSIQYTWQQTIYTADRTVYFDNNYKFDTTLSDFAKINEIIYSKVNENEDILVSSPDRYRIYPCIDEFGYEYGDRFIFKSSWDKEFFIRTNRTLKNDAGIV